MKWINFLKSYKIPYYIYKLNTNDSLIICDEYNKKKQLAIILHGSIYITKNFKNKKTITIVLLNKNSIFNGNYTNYQFYYQLTALETTYILTIKGETIKKLANKPINSIIKSYKKTCNAYQIMNEAINQTNKKNKVLQIILLIFLQFGIINKKEVELPFKISQKNLSTISGASTTTVNKIIKDIIKKNLLSKIKKQYKLIRYLS